MPEGTQPDPPTSPEALCSECGKRLGPEEDKQATEDRVFCRPCYERLVAQVREVARAQGTDINYVNATVGGILGGALGVLAWWAITVWLNVAFGLIAVVIGIAVGTGVVRFSGGKRSPGLQGLSVVLATVSFFFATYLVNRTFVQQALSAQGQDGTLPMLPTPRVFFLIVRAGFGLMDLVFLAIALYQAWRIPRPILPNA